MKETNQNYELLLRTSQDDFRRTGSTQYFNKRTITKILMNRGNLKIFFINFLFVFLFVSIKINAQEEKIKNVESFSSIYKLSGILGNEKDRRVVVPIDLEGAQLWGYTFTTGSGLKDVDRVSIRASFKRYINFRIDNIPIPKGTDNCRIYIMDKESSEVFKAGGKDFYYLEKGSIANMTSDGKRIPLKRELKNIYLGIENANDIQALDIHLEVFRIYENE